MLVWHKLTVTFVLVGMMFLVPAITQKAQAWTQAHVWSILEYKNLRWNLDAGTWGSKVDEGPPHKNPCCPLTWTTVGKGLGGDEKGWVQYDVLSLHGRDEIPSVLGTVTFRWYNPTSGTNTCSVDKPPPNIAVGCTIPTHGSQVYVDYCVDYDTTSSTCKAEPYNPNTVLEKKPLHTHLAKIILPYHQSHLTVKSIQSANAVSRPKSTGGAMAATHHLPQSFAISHMTVPSHI